MSTLDQRNGFKNKGLPINGSRPTPLRINKNSNVIHKESMKKPSEPVIIYAVSPKVIHTRPRDFMALVQSLTGSNSSQYTESTAEMDHGGDPKGLPIHVIDDQVQGYHNYDDSGSSSSGSEDQKIIDINIENINVKKESIACYLVSPTMFMVPNKASIRDIPLYTPNWDF